MTTKEHNDKYFSQSYEDFSKSNSYVVLVVGVSDKGVSVMIPPDTDKKLLLESLETIKKSLV